MRRVRNLSVLALAVVMGALAPAVRPAPVLAACVASPDSVTVLEDHTVFVDALGNDPGCNYIKYWTPALHGSLADDPLDNVNNWTYTPAANYFGTDGNDYAATVSGPDESASSVAYTIIPVNDPPEVVAFDGLGAMEDVPGINGRPDQATAGPFESTQTITATMVTGNPALFATGPTLVLSKQDPNWSATITWTPKPDACGTSQQTITFKDNGGTANGGVDTTVVTPTLTITCVNDETVVRDDTYATRPGIPLVVGVADGVLANDSDVDGDTLASVVFTSPSHGTLDGFSFGGAFTYIPDPGFEGTDTFQYAVGGGGPVPPIGTVTIRVDGTAPVFTARTPTASSTGRPRDTQPSITFSDGIRASTLTASTLRLKDKASGTLISGSIAYDPAARRATFKPASLLGAGRTYTVIATSGIKNLAGLAFAGTSWSFTVTGDATRPKVVTKSPAPSATGVSRSSNVTARFSESVRRSTVNATTVRLQDLTTGAIVPATVVYDAGSRKAILDPSIRLAARRTYKVLVSSTIRDKAGNRLRASSWTFKTGG